MIRGIYKFLFFFFLLGSISCNKYLDITPKGQIVLTTAEDYVQLMDNVSAVGTFVISDLAYVDDEGWLNASNVVSAWSTMTLNVANLLYKEAFDRSLNASGNSGSTGTSVYQGLYQNISKIANTILFGMDDIQGSEADKKSLAAQAKMLRAFNYFLLINMYAKPYDKSTADTDGGVPLKLDPLMETVPDPAQSSVAQIYAQIEKDITEALPDLPEIAATPYRFNKAAGYALKAKVHLFKKEFDACIEAALMSFQLNSATFNLPVLVSTTTNKPTTPLYASGEENLYFATTSLSYTYIGQELTDLFTASLRAYGQANNVTDARLDLYKRPASTVKDYQFIMSYIPTSKEYSTNSMGLRTTEVMLMLAECYARKGDNEKVKQYLEPYLKSRYRNYVHANLVLPADITATVQMVINERRKELRMGANRFFDLRRLNTETAYRKEPARTVPADPVATPNIPQLTYTLPVRSPLYILPFPGKVLANDPRLTSNTW